MGIKDIIRNLGERQREKKELINNMSDQVRFQKIVEERQLSSNERELNRFHEENREEMIKHQLEIERKRRDEDIKFAHNPLNTPNITNHTEWEVLREKNQFSDNNNIFVGQKSVLKSNKNLMKNNSKLFKGGNLFKI